MERRKTLRRSDFLEEKRRRMERLTRKTDTGYVVEDPKQAVERLAKFENFYMDLQAKQEELTKKLEILKGNGEKNSVKFRQLLGQKMTNSGILILLKTYGIED